MEKGSGNEFLMIDSFGRENFKLYNIIIGVRKGSYEQFRMFISV